MPDNTNRYRQPELVDVLGSRSHAPLPTPQSHIEPLSKIHKDLQHLSSGVERPVAFQSELCQCQYQNHDIQPLNRN
jgi:hypothetical protein